MSRIFANFYCCTRDGKKFSIKNMNFDEKKKLILGIVEEIKNSHRVDIE